MRLYLVGVPMFDTVILLTGPAEQEPLASVLKNHNPQLAVHPARILADLEALDKRMLARARLIAFLSSVVVPNRMLSRLGFGAYNFHPGPPNYPGWMPAHFATYDRASDFGVTAHAITQQVDAGPIVGVDLFAVPPHTSVLELEKMAFVALARLFWQLAPMLATQGAPLPELPMRWRGRKSTRKMYAEMCQVAPDISKQELDRRVPVFGAGHLGIELTVNLHGYTFRYVPAENAQAEAPSIVPAEPSKSEKV